MSTNIRIVRICQYCGNEFEAKTTVTKYCSHKCNSRAYKQKVKQEKIQESDIATQKFRDQPLLQLNTLDYLTPKDAATLLQCDPRTIYMMINTGRLRAINLSVRKTRILKKDIDSIFSNPELIIKPKPMKIPGPLTIDDCYSMGEILQIYDIGDHTLARVIQKYNIVKYRKGKYVYASKEVMDKVLRKYRKRQQQ